MVAAGCGSKVACLQGNNANSLTQPVESVRLSHRVLRELAQACGWLSPCFRNEPVGTTADPFLSKKMTITLPSIRRQSLGV
jgi:hypothetical protein